MLKRSVSARIFTAVPVLALLTFALAVPAAGQSTGTIQGTLTDPTSAPIPNAAVAVREENTGQERTITTDTAGFYSVPSLPVGTWRVEVKASGMAPTAAFSGTWDSSAASSRSGPSKMQTPPLSGGSSGQSVSGTGA